MILYHFPKDCRNIWKCISYIVMYFMTMVFNFFFVRSLFDTQKANTVSGRPDTRMNSGDHLDPDVSSDPVAM